MNEWMSKQWMNEWMKEWMNEQTMNVTGLTFESLQKHLIFNVLQYHEIKASVTVWL